MYNEIIEMIAKQFKIDSTKLTRDTNILTDINADSLDIVDLLIKLEEKYGTTINDDQLDNIKTVGDIEDYFKDKKNNK